MRWRPVHQYQALVLCPECGRSYVEEGDTCCWICAPETIPTRDELWRAWRAREAAEAVDGSVGSMIGLGFAPASTSSLPTDALPAWGPPPAPAHVSAAPPAPYSKTTSVRGTPPAPAEWRFAMWLLAAAALAVSVYLLWMGGAFGPNP